MRAVAQTRRNQSGAALIVSLMMLLVLTIIGVSSIGGTNLEERMAQNFQHSAMAFQASETAINEVITAGTVTDSSYDSNSDPLLDASEAGIDDTSTVVSYGDSDLDPGGYLEAAALSVDATVVYTANGGCLIGGDSLGVDSDTQCDYYEVTSSANIDLTSTQVSHLQGLYRPVPN